jgi:hypothetical protein
MPTWCTFRNAARKEHVARESTDAAAEIAIKPQAPEFQNSPLKIIWAARREHDRADEEQHGGRQRR